VDTHTIENLRLVLQMGDEVQRFMESPGWQRALTRVRARHYDDTMRGATLAIREETRSEARALERLLEALVEVQHEGIYAREALVELADEDAA
jgi:hypothetical protein